MIQILIYVHAVLGAIALLLGAVAIGSRKGLKLHKRSGKVFYYSMLLSSIISIVITFLPDHENTFLRVIGLFTCYFLVSGYRSLSFKKVKEVSAIDKLITACILILAAVMIGLGLWAQYDAILLIFGIIALLFGISDINALRDPAILRKKWLVMHVGKITGAYIASVTAFLVVNNLLPGIWNWFAPTILGTVFITYWTAKVSRAMNSAQGN